MCGITTHVLQTRCFDCINFIGTQFNLLQTKHMCVASETYMGASPTLECVNFIAAQFNLLQTTPSVASKTCGRKVQFNVSLPQ